MKTYTFINDNRYRSVSIYRSYRFTIERLEINLIGDGSRPSFVRGMKITDFELNEYVLVHGTHADDLIYTMAKIVSNNAEDDPTPYDAYLAEVIKSRSCTTDAVILNMNLLGVTTVFH